MYQKLVAYGRLGKSPEKVTTQNGNIIAKFSLAVTEKRKQDANYVDHTEWFNCIAFGKTAEFITSYIQKGQLVFIEAVQNTNKYLDREGNEKRSVDFIVNRIHSDKINAATSTNQTLEV